MKSQPGELLVGIAPGKKGCDRLLIIPSTVLYIHTTKKLMGNTSEHQIRVSQDTR